MKMKEKVVVRQEETSNDQQKSMPSSFENFKINVFVVGLRNMREKFKESDFLQIEISMGNLKIETTKSNKFYDKNLNFLCPLTGIVNLPDDPKFWSRINIKLFNVSNDKEKTLIAQGSIISSEVFFNEDEDHLTTINEMVDYHDKTDENQPLLENDHLTFFPTFLQKLINLDFLKSFSNQNDSEVIESQFNWWTKFYNSARHPKFRNKHIHQLKIFPIELENLDEYEKLQDWAISVDLWRTEESEMIEKFSQIKLSISLRKVEEDTTLIPEFDPLLMSEIPVVIRVYIAKAIGLRPRDEDSASDPYIKIKFGDVVISDRDNFLRNQSNPIFGRKFEFFSTIPTKSTIMKISIFDKDEFTDDDMIGSTTIDIEDRMRSKYFLSSGIPNEFNQSGYNIWRNSFSPSELLEIFCNQNQLSNPIFHDNHIKIGDTKFLDSSKITKDENMKERLALSTLNNIDKVSGFKIIPEHIESRSLYLDGIEQGKLLMWIEIFDARNKVPDSLDISPPAANVFELRVIIWNVKDVTLNDRNIFGDVMSDIYVKAWISNVGDAQKTDTHYRSLNGEGNFNWRMIFKFKYSYGEDMMIVKRGQNELRFPPILQIQIWDKDSLTADDFLGNLFINLSCFSKPFDDAFKCSKNIKRSKENLFAIGNTRGWFPVYENKLSSENHSYQGKIELELEVLTKLKASNFPVGIARNEPNALPPPK